LAGDVFGLEGRMETVAGGRVPRPAIQGGCRHQVERRKVDRPERKKKFADREG